MSDQNKAKSLIEGINKRFDALTADNQKSVAEVARLQNELTAMQKDLDATNARLKSSAATTGSDKLDRSAQEYRNVVFPKLLKNAQLSDAERSLADQYRKDFNVGTANQGGVFLP